MASYLSWPESPPKPASTRASIQALTETCCWSHHWWCPRRPRPESRGPQHPFPEPGDRHVPPFLDVSTTHGISHPPAGDGGEFLFSSGVLFPSSHQPSSIFRLFFIIIIILIMNSNHGFVSILEETHIWVTKLIFLYLLVTRPRGLSQPPFLWGSVRAGRGQKPKPHLGLAQESSLGHILRTLWSFPILRWELKYSKTLGGGKSTRQEDLGPWLFISKASC